MTKKLTPSDMGKLSHQKMKERLGEEGYREMQLRKSLKAKMARELKKRHAVFTAQLEVNECVLKMKKGVDKSFDKESTQDKI